MSALRTVLARRLARNVPFMVTVGLHALAIIVAAVWVVSETIVGSSKRFEAAPPPAKSAVQRQMEHRVQIARRNSAAGSAAPVSATRIRSTSSDALVLPELPVLPQSGAGGFGGFGGPGAGLGTGPGGGLATSLGAGGLGGRGLMSMSFLGLTQVRVERVVFVVDVGRSLMDIRKGGFRAFEIIRGEILRLVSQLPPSAEFGVVLFDDNLVNRYASRLAPATAAEKEAFFAWMQPVNRDTGRLGAHSAGQVERWEAPVAEADELGYRPSIWGGAVQAALELKPETIFLITGTAGTGTTRVSEAERDRRAQVQQRNVAALARQGLTPESINQARQAALAKAQEHLRRINDQLASQGRDPFVVRSSRRLLDTDFQAALRKAGFRLEVNLQGWTDTKGEPIWDAFSRTQTVERATGEHLHQFLARLQSQTGRSAPAVLNIFLFTGHDERPAADAEVLTSAARRNGGRFSLLTSARLNQLAAGR